jgi:hypothetical protein
MTSLRSDYNLVIIGAGFYGCAIGIYLAKAHGVKNILIIERENEIFQRASYNNQARVHNGYHYPRDLITALRSRVNFPNFIKQWDSAIKKDFINLYGISRKNSKITSKQFFRFSKEIGAEIKIADQAEKDMFNPKLVEEVFQVKEYAFDANMISTSMLEELANLDIEIILESTVDKIFFHGRKDINVEINNTDKFIINCNYIINSSYSGIGQIAGDFPEIKNKIKHELVEMPLVEMPENLFKYGITIMDGPFFSIMPFPPKNLHTLSHVRYTPHIEWFDSKGNNPYEILSRYNKKSEFDLMVREASRYIPTLENIKYVDSLFEIKTILLKNEINDGRPILFETYKNFPGLYSILGAKIDNIYDVFSRLGKENFS